MLFFLKHRKQSWLTTLLPSESFTGLKLFPVLYDSLIQDHTLSTPEANGHLPHQLKTKLL